MNLAFPGNAFSQQSPCSLDGLELEYVKELSNEPPEALRERAALRAETQDSFPELIEAETDMDLFYARLREVFPQGFDFGECDLVSEKNTPPALREKQSRNIS